MPATAGRVRMPANNRVHSSAALQTHGIWQSAIGYDPYAPTKDDSKAAPQSKTEGDPENPYANFQELLQLARITGTNADEARGACQKCGRVGHLTFQCRNFLSVKDVDKEKDLDFIQADVMAGLKKIKRKVRGTTAVETSESSDEESESSDSSEDSEMERIIAERLGKKNGSKSRSLKKKKDRSEDDDSESAERKKRGRSKRRRSKKRSESDSDGEDDTRRRRVREKRRKRDESSDDEEQSRRRRRKSRKEKSTRRRKSRRAGPSSDSDISDSDGVRVGRDSKRSDKKSRKRYH